MKVLISGYYGFGNVGDEAVLQSILQELRKHDPQLEATVLSAFPSLTKELYRVEAIFRYNWFEIFRRMLKTDAFISGGGTLFQNVTSNRSFLYYIGLVFLAQLCRKKTVVFAQGFGPLRGAFCRLLARFVLNRADLIMLRDSDSCQELKRLGVSHKALYVTGDPTAVLEVSSSQQGEKILEIEGIKNAARPLLGISLRGLPTGDDDRFFEEIAKLLDWVSQTYNYSPLFILFHSPEDMHVTFKVTALMKEKSNLVFRICRPKEMLGLIAHLDCLIGMRLHSLIFAAMNCVPMLGISYDPKVEAFMKMIGQPYVDLEQDPDLNGMKKKLEEIFANKEAIKVGLAVKKKKLYDRASLNFELLFT